MKSKVMVAVAAFAMVAPAMSAGPGGSSPAGKNSPVKLESIPGSKVKRITLTARAHERLGVQTGKVAMESLVRTQMVSGLVVPPMAGGTPAPRMAGGVFGGFSAVAAAPEAQPPAVTKAPANGEAWLMVALSEAEWNRLAKDKPARMLPLATRDKLGAELSAMPTGMAPLIDNRRSMLTVFYKFKAPDEGKTMALNTRMRVELHLEGSAQKNKVVPYSAVYYDAKGQAWVYLNPQPLVFERQQIAVERVVGDVAVLSEGPPVGTAVVTVGAPLLYGTEIFGK